MAHLPFKPYILLFLDRSFVADRHFRNSLQKEFGDKYREDRSNLANCLAYYLGEEGLANYLLSGRPTFSAFNYWYENYIQSRPFAKSSEANASEVETPQEQAEGT